MLSKIKQFIRSRVAKGDRKYLKDYAGKVEMVRRFNGKHYYRFKDDLDMPYARYIYLASFTQAIEMRMTLETLTHYIKHIQTALSGGKGKVDIGEALITLKKLETRCSVLFDESLAYDLASCVFFTDEEILNGYDIEYNKKKIAAWREVDAINFFMEQPVRGLLNLQTTSITDLETYLNQVRPIVEELNSSMLQAINNAASTNTDAMSKD